MKISFLNKLALLVLLVFSKNTLANSIDWNSTQIQWRSYQQGIAELKRTNKLGIIVIYADWCSTCLEYSKIFNMQQVVSELNGITIIKANVDKDLEVKALKEYDEKYVPKTIVIDKNGNVATPLYDQKRDFMFFLPTNKPDQLLDIIKKVKRFNQKI